MTKQETQVSADQKQLGRTEAGWVADWLEQVKGKYVKGGWTAVYRLTPADVARDYDVALKDVIRIARR